MRQWLSDMFLLLMHREMDAKSARKTKLRFPYTVNINIVKFKK